MLNVYSPIEAPRLIDASCVSALFGKPAKWFERDRVRKALYARGFPVAVIRAAGRAARSTPGSRKKATATSFRPSTLWHAILCRPTCGAALRAYA
jgi:hypothetical protein